MVGVVKVFPMSCVGDYEGSKRRKAKRLWRGLLDEPGPGDKLPHPN